MNQIPLRYSALLASVFFIIIGISTSFFIQTDFGNVHTKEVDFLTEEGVLIHSTLQVPKIATSTNPRPGVVIIHGVYQSKEWLRAFGIELTRRGFVALTIDAASHGNSGYASYNSDRGGVAALEYLHNLPYVSKLGLVGHSMGAGIAIQALNITTLPIDSLVFVGGGSRNMEEWANTTYPKNLLITVGRYDELFDIQDLYSSLGSIFGISSVNPNQLYGDFDDGTARKLIIGETNHLFETIDPIIISETIDWLNDSLFDTTNEKWKSKSNLIYPFWIIGGGISCIGIILSIIPLMAILIDLPFFYNLKNNPDSKYEVTTRNYWIYGLVYAIITSGSFLPAILFPSVLPFPQNLGDSVGIWLVVSALLGILVFILIKRFQIEKNNPQISWGDFGIDEDYKTFSLVLGRSTLLALLIFLWLYCWTLLVDIFLALDFSVFLPLFNDLPYNPPRLQMMPIYLIFTVPFFLIEGMWLMGILRTNSKETWRKTRLFQTGKAVVIKCGIYALILLVQLMMGLLLGKPFIYGFLGFYLLFFWILTPFFIITTLITSWSYFLTKRVYIGAMLNSIIFSWTLASILTLAM
ncbi:MAG: alpha/beta hydrolase [Candidatus Hodarchaeota archaeon]